MNKINETMNNENLLYYGTSVSEFNTECEHINNKIKYRKEEIRKIYDSIKSCEIELNNEFQEKKFRRYFVLIFPYVSAIILFFILYTWWDDGGPFMGAGFWAIVVSIIGGVLISLFLKDKIPYDDNNDYNNSVSNLYSKIKSLKNEIEQHQNLIIELEEEQNKIMLNNQIIENYCQEFESKNFFDLMEIHNKSLNEQCQNNSFSTFTDPRDGKQYQTIQIGNQIWFVGNLSYIPFVCPPKDNRGIWVLNYHGYNVEEATQTKEFTRSGCLYNWEMAQKVIPIGWRIPTANDWIKLAISLGGSNTASQDEIKRFRLFFKFLLPFSNFENSGLSSQSYGLKTTFDGGDFSEDDENMISYLAFDNNLFIQVCINFNQKAIRLFFDEPEDKSSPRYGYPIKCVKDI